MRKNTKKKAKKDKPASPRAFTRNLSPAELFKSLNVPKVDTPTLCVGNTKYQCTEMGIWQVADPTERDKEDEAQINQLTNFIVTNLVEVIKDDGIQKSQSFEIVAKQHGKVFGPIPISADEFTRMTWVIRVLGTQGIIFPPLRSNIDHARTAIQAFFPRRVTRTEYTATGWYEIEGEPYFLHAGGAIGRNGATTKFKATVPGNLRLIDLSDLPEGDDLKNAVRTTLEFLDVASDSISVPLFGAATLAPLGDARLSVHLSGATGTRKTSLATVVQQFFGKEFRANRLPDSFHSTGLANEELLFLASSVVAVIDDFVPQGDRGDIARANAQAADLYRSVSNQSGRARLNPAGQRQEGRPPRALLVSTGEDLPRGQSVNARVVNISMTAPALNMSALSKCQEQAELGTYAQAWAAYIQWLASRRDSLRSTSDDRIREIRSMIQCPGNHARVPENLAKLMFGIEVFLTFAEEIEAVTAEEVQALSSRCLKALKAVAQDQSSVQRQEDPADEAIRLLVSADAAGRLSFDPVRASSNSDRNGPGNQPWVGWRDGENSDWFCLENELFRVLTTLHREQGTTLPWAKSTLWKRWSEQGYLRKGEKRRHTVRLRIGGKQRRVLAIPHEIIDRFTEGDEPGIDAQSVDSP